MSRINCGDMHPGCEKSRNTYHKCKRTIKLTEKQEKAIFQGGRIDGPNSTDYCKGHKCEFCDKVWK